MALSKNINIRKKTGNMCIGLTTVKSLLCSYKNINSFNYQHLFCVSLSSKAGLRVHVSNINLRPAEPFLRQATHLPEQLSPPARAPPPPAPLLPPAAPAQALLLADCLLCNVHCKRLSVLLLLITTTNVIIYTKPSNQKLSIYQVQYVIM